LRAALPGLQFPKRPSILEIKVAPRKRTVLQTLSRTLTPSRRAADSSVSVTSYADIVDISGETRGESLASLASYLTALSGIKDIRGQQEWTAFFRIGKEDLESKRVERRYACISLLFRRYHVLIFFYQSVKRVRSDLAKHAATDVSKASAAKAHQGTPGTTPGGSSDAVEKLAESETTGTIEDAGNSTMPSASSSSVELALPPRPLSADGTKNDDRVVTVPHSPKPSKDKRRRRKGKEESKVSLKDFEMLSVLGKGCAGKVSLIFSADRWCLY
jgi:serum/glucocorticoid-regulated kinase 2